MSNSTSPTFDLITSIKELQGLEEYMFQQLESININDPNNISQQNDIIKHINDLSDLRNDLFGQLGKMYVNLDKNSQVKILFQNGFKILKNLKQHIQHMLLIYQNEK